MVTIFKKALDAITPEKWANCCRHTENIILDTYRKEVGCIGETNADFALVVDLEDDDDSD